MQIAELQVLASEAGADRIVEEARVLVERVTEGRFYMACVGQFKRGKSTLINALIGQAVLPAGVVPVTAVVTVVRYDDSPHARVRFSDGRWSEIPLGALTDYVSEHGNPSNTKEIEAVEVYVPSSLLATGMCLVDTPGIGSVFATNTEATRAFIPHIDAAIIVIGADPPISGDELDMVAEVAQRIGTLLFVLNKADRMSEKDLSEAIEFTRRVIAEKIGRHIDSVYRISASERLSGTGSSRDWEALVSSLELLARESGAEIVRDAEKRGVRLLAQRLANDIEEQRTALVRPIEETEWRIQMLHRAISDAEQMLRDVSYLFTAEQHRISREFSNDREQFLEAAIPQATKELSIVTIEKESGRTLRETTYQQAQDIARRWLVAWVQNEQPKAEDLYRHTSRRFVEIANSILERLAELPGLEHLPRTISPETGFRSRSHLYFTEKLTLAAPSALQVVLDAIIPAHRRRSQIITAAIRYLTHLLETNSARVVNDLAERVLESRRGLEREIRRLLRDLAVSAEAAMAKARSVRAAGEAATKTEVARLASVYRRVQPFLLSEEPHISDRND